MNNKTIETYKLACKNLAIEFFEYYFEEKIDKEDVDYTGSHENWHYGDMYVWTYDMIQVLENQYDRNLVTKWYDYSMNHHGTDYYLNINHFMRRYRDYQKLNLKVSFEEWHKLESDKNREFWSSPEWVAETEKQMEELKNKYLKDINY